MTAARRSNNVDGSIEHSGHTQRHIDINKDGETGRESDKRTEHITNKSSRRPHTSAKENMVGIRSPYPDPDPDSGFGLLPKVNADFLSKDTSAIKFMKIRSLSLEI